MRWAGNAELWGKRDLLTWLLLGSLKKSDHSEDIDVDGKVTLKCDWRL
jgi:hypothetical protein